MLSRARSVLFVLLMLLSRNVYAADHAIVFQKLSDDDITLVQQILGSDVRFNDLVQRDYIRIPEDVHIAKADLDDSGTAEVMLMVKRNGDESCAQKPCELQIWKNQETMIGAWKKIGTYQMKEEPIKFYDEKYNGFHEIANSSGIIPWYDN